VLALCAASEGGGASTICGFIPRIRSGQILLLGKDFAIDRVHGARVGAVDVAGEVRAMRIRRNRSGRFSCQSERR